MANISTSAQAENAQKVMVAAARYTREHNAVAYNLITKMELPKGHRSVQAPKVGAFTFSDLTEGEDMTDEQQVNIRTVELTVKEVGAKVILSDVLLDQNATTPIMSIVGRQAANGFARKSDTDVTALYPGLNGGTAFGGAADSFVVSNAASVILKCQGKTEPFDPDYVVQHPYQYFPLLRSASVVGGVNLNPPPGRQEKLLADFFRWSLNGVDFYQDDTHVNFRRSDALDYAWCRVAHAWDIAPHVWTLTDNGGNAEDTSTWTCRKDGVAQTVLTGGGPTAGVLAHTSELFGTRSAGAVFVPWPGTIDCLLIANAGLSTTKRDALEAFATAVITP